MAEPHVVATLIRKRGEIAGQIEHTQTQLRQLIIDLDNLDATIRLFKPAINLEEIRPKPLPPRHHAFKGEVSRIVFAVLRQSNRAITAQEIAQHVMAERGLNMSDKQLVQLVGKRVGHVCVTSGRRGWCGRSKVWNSINCGESRVESIHYAPWMMSSLQIGMPVKTAAGSKLTESLTRRFFAPLA